MKTIMVCLWIGLNKFLFKPRIEAAGGDLKLYNNSRQVSR